MTFGTVWGGVVTSYNVKSYGWSVCNFYDSFVRCSVPLFVMLSGTFFLDNSKPLPWQKLAKKTFRLITAFVFWSACYALVNTVRKYGFLINGHVIISFLGRFISGSYHMWFLFMIVGLYLVTPMLREIAKDRKLSWYFVALWFVFWSCTSLVVKIPTYGKYFSSIFDNIGIHTVLGYSGYYVLGYLLSTMEMDKRLKPVLYVVGPLSLIVSVIGTAMLSGYKGKLTEVLYSNSSPNVVLWSVAVFVFFKEEVSRIKLSDKCSRRVRYLSKLTFGMYLTHVFAIGFLNKVFHLNAGAFNPLFSVPIVSLLVFAISFVVAFVIDHIPGVRKYII